MNLPSPKGILFIFASLALVVAWAIVIWVAAYVSRIVIDSLQMIVELAAISPG